MALIRCSECGNQVSDKADACPVCGYPIKSEHAKQQRSAYLSEKVNDTKNSVAEIFSKFSLPKVFALLTFLALIFYPWAYNPYAPSSQEDRELGSCLGEGRLYGVSGKHDFMANAIRWVLLNTSLGQLQVRSNVRNKTIDKLGEFVSDPYYRVWESPEWECYAPYLMKASSLQETHFYVQLVETNRGLIRELKVAKWHY